MSGEKFIGDFERSDNLSDGDVTCDTYCGADSHAIRKGASVYYKMSNVEYGEYRAVCRKHALAETK